MGRISLVALGALLCASCGGAPVTPAAMPAEPVAKAPAPVAPRSDTYDLYWFEKTGLTRYVQVGERHVAIEFSSNSDPVAVASLLALNYDIARANDKGRGLRLLGELEPGIHQSRAEPIEPYQYFRLDGWHLETPFRVLQWGIVDGFAGQLPLEGVRAALEPSDFEEFPGRDHIDLSRFMRKR